MRQTDANRESRHSRVGIKWKVFGWFALFTVIILVILWLFQIVFLDDIYKTVKTAEIKLSAHDMLRAVDSDSFEDDVEFIARKSDLCLIVLKMHSDDQALELLSVQTLNNCAIHNTDRSSKFTLYDAAKASGGSIMQHYRYDRQRRVYVGVDDADFAKTPDTQESIFYSVITENSNGETLLFLLNSVISPVEATVKTLNILLVVISLILFIISLVMSIVVSRIISRPIVKLTDSARLLADGNYDIGFARDRTISRSYREASDLAATLDYASEELSKAENLRRELIANISHDLRTPLTMIEGYGEVMRDLPGENTPENVQIIIDEAKRLSSLVNDVLDLSRLQSGAIEFKSEPIDITELISNTLKRYNKLCEADGYRIEFEYDVHVIVDGDVTRLTQVIYNLVNNAVTYTGEDKTVRVCQSPSEGRVRISVSDSGEGIPAEKLEHIWDRYYKGEKAHRRASVGTGLGLSIVKSAVDMHGGRYGVDSEVGMGSTFWVELDVIGTK